MSVGKAMLETADRLFAGSRGRPDGYVLCTTDGFWFRPPYTDGKCPLCGEIAPGGAPPPPLLLRLDRFTLGVGFLAVASAAMSILVLVMYFG
ncbi:MAG TPA: hypothetical protein VFJ91_07670 [Gaiellaceae bacterium]|nr:hypothetical protein [Gaiellaceae bacterium]